MTVIETKEKIETELKAVVESFGEASSLVSYSIEIDVNHIEGEEHDITSVFGSLSIGPADAEEDEKLYLPLDAELTDDDLVEEELFEKTLAQFKARVATIRERVLASDDYTKEIKAIIEEFDSEMEAKYQAEMERINSVAKRNLIIAGVATAIAAVVAIAVLVAEKLA